MCRGQVIINGSIQEMAIHPMKENPVPGTGGTNEPL